MKLLSMILVLGFVAIPAMGAPPVVGAYYSYDLPGGTFNAGRFSESWVDPGTHGQIGNTVNAESWNGTALGTEWKLWCPSIQTPPVLVSDTRVNGTGDVTYRTVYSGGHFFLGAVGPWGDEDYTGDLNFFVITTTYMYVDNALLGIRSNVVSYGQIAGYTDCMEYEINNAAFFGTTDTGTKPADYPAFLDESCSEGVWIRGGWGSATQIAIRIRGECNVGVEPSTWGQIKALYSAE
jgi:hypothetical protein